MNKVTVAVLMGGISAEREVSLWTGEQVLRAIDRTKYEVAAYDPSALDGRESLVIAGQTLGTLEDLISARGASKPDVAFIALHGPGGEDGTIQGLLEAIRIPYTGSGVLASALAMDKAMSKLVLGSVGVTLAEGRTLSRNDRQIANTDSFPMPCIVKPSNQGSSIGMVVVRRPSELQSAIDLAFKYDDTILIEEYIAGTEITVPVLGNESLQVLPIVEIVPKDGFFDYHSKYTPGATEEIVPARLEPEVAERAREIAKQCHVVLGCRGMSRTDMIVTGSGAIVTLETNTIPGMAPTSILPQSAAAAGITFPDLIDHLICLALEK